MMPDLLKKIFLVDLFHGLWVTFRQQPPKYVCTEQYPQQRPKIAARYRGVPRMRTSPETGQPLCNCCNLCVLACPERLIVMTSLRNEQTRRKELVSYTFDTSRCMFCGLCQDACTQRAIELTQDFELATYTRQGQIWELTMLEEGPHPTPYKY
jgi:NADH-quinone oxidoreductase subunit I